MRASVGVLGGVVLLAACQAVPGGDTDLDNSAGLGVPQQFVSEEFPGERSAVRVRVHVAANGCFLGTVSGPGATGRHLVVWPRGTRQGSSADELRLPQGTVVRDRDLLEGQGLLMPRKELEGFGNESYWDVAVGFCTPDASHVLVLDAVTRR
jgi:hypothetical protein